MSKKRFTDGLESLFGLPPEQDNLPDASPLLVETEIKEAPTKKSKKKGRKGKNFMSDLDSLLDDALQDTFDEQINRRAILDETAKKPATSPRRVSAKKRSLRPVTGLDALIRQTIETTDVEVNYNTRKRITFAFDKDKLAKLKKIAKIEKSYLKDILGGVVTEYIEKYEKQKGNVKLDS